MITRGSVYVFAGYKMSSLSSSGLDDIIARGAITDFDVARLRRSFYKDGIISSQEADTLFKANDACSVKDASWTDFFIEALTDYVVNQVTPEGYVTVENADWLIQRIAHDGHVETKTELDLLVTVLERARWSPVRLARYALAEVKRAVIEDTGPLRTGGGLQKGVIAEAEVELLRRVLYAFGGDGNIAITRDEAEVLFELNDATANAEPNPAWTDLFTKAIANVLMASSGYAVPSREKALQAEAWLDSRGDVGPASLFNKMITGSLSAVLTSYREQSPEERAIARLERQRTEIVTNEIVTEDEANWLADRLGRDGVLSANEKALIAFLQKESPKIHPILAERVAKLAEAA